MQEVVDVAAARRGEGGNQSAWQEVLGVHYLDTTPSLFVTERIPTAAKEHDSGGWSHLLVSWQRMLWWERVCLTHSCDVVAPLPVTFYINGSVLGRTYRFSLSRQHDHPWGSLASENSAGGGGISTRMSFATRAPTSHVLLVGRCKAGNPKSNTTTLISDSFTLPLCCEHLLVD